ncbi:MAG: glycosyltransferase family 4 protein, partial [Nanoarchaeota archaeon]
LPAKAQIIVYTGHISKERGTDRLIEAFKIVQKNYSDAVLLLSGQIDKDININQPGIVYKELPRRKDVVIAINAADVAVVPHPENEATKYGIPYKLLEYMACDARIVATAVGDVKELLKDYPQILAQPGNPEDLALKITATIDNREKTSYNKIVTEYTWEKLARKLNTELVKLK